MTEVKHTPLKIGNKSYTILDKNGEGYAVASDAEKAALIVLACNSRDDLVVTATYALEQIQRTYHGEPGADIGSAIEPLIEALAKAKGAA